MLLSPHLCSLKLRSFDHRKFPRYLSYLQSISKYLKSFPFTNLLLDGHEIQFPRFRDWPKGGSPAWVATSFDQ